MKGKGTIVGVITVVCLVLFVKFLPFERESSGITMWLDHQATEQAENSDKITSAAIAPAEGEGGFAGEHKVDGSNWAIPNLLRHWFGVD